MSTSHALVVDSPVQPLERFVDADTAADFLGITRRNLLQKVRAGKIPGHPLDRSAQKREWRFKLSELDRLLAVSAISADQSARPTPRNKQ